MDTTDRSDSRLPAPFSAASSPLLLPRAVPDRELAIAPAPPQIDSGVIKRGLVRHWWHILGLWIILSAAAAVLIFKFMVPTYEAVSRIRVEPINLTLFKEMDGSLASDARSYEPYLQTQITLMKSDQVLNRAISDPSVSNQEFIKRSLDAKTDLREKMDVEIEPNTYMIRVGLESKNPTEAANIVNAVVTSYLDENLRYSQGQNTKLKGSLDTELKSLGEEIKKKKEELKRLNEEGRVQVYKPPLNLNPSKNDDEGASGAGFATVGQQQVDTMINRMVQIDMELLTLRAELKTRLEAQKGLRDANLQAQEEANEDLEERVKQAFYDDPEVKAFISNRQNVADELERLKGLARKSGDRAVSALKVELAKLDKEWKELWDGKSEEIRNKLKMTTDGRPTIETVAELQRKIQMLQDQKVGLGKMYDNQKAEQKTTNNDAFQFTYAQQELNQLIAREELVRRNLTQVEFLSRHEQYRITLLDKAEVPKVPSNNKRFKYILAAPAGALFLTLGLFLLLEIKSGRIADPDILSTRVRSEVYGLPALPKSRQLSKRDESAFDDQIEQFIQRLDHLRFAVCSTSAHSGQGRCVLITSAIGSEGKTTLAAYLAIRCGNAGLRVLLIDADLRRSSLCKMLNEPEGPGLSDLLKDDFAIDDVLVPVQGDTFKLLRAGTPMRDTSAMLQGHRFGMLIAQFRQHYDLIIIDSPPVLPVPDALMLGQWTDGAVLAARYDKSRFPQVERARRQLDSAGIAVLGTVINGMRGSDSYYGKYTYSRRRSPEADLSNTS
jgi:succinoglycan biosynthesis transport protein ExoP